MIVVANEPQATQVQAAFRATPGITGVTPPVTRDGHAWLQGTLTSAPDSQAAFATIDRVRANVHAVPGADAMVGGNTAITLDIARAADHDRKVIIPIILALVFVILALLLRALVAPIMLIATVVLSFAAALGVSSLFFNHVFNYGNADNSFPLFVFVFLVALGIDYNIFLMTRVREEAARHGPRRGALTGLSATGGVITSAGFVLAGTFAALSTLPVTFLAEPRLRGGVRRTARHPRRQVRAGHRAQPGPGTLAVVAEQAVPAIGSGGGATGGAASGSAVGQRRPIILSYHWPRRIAAGHRIRGGLYVRRPTGGSKADTSQAIPQAVK